MLTKNFYSYIGAALQQTSAQFRLMSGTTMYLSLVPGHKPPISVMNSWSKSVAETGVSFGTGTTPATLEDYKLESILGNTQISVSNPSAVSFSRGATFDEYSVSFGVTNITDEAITISEVGLAAMPHNDSSTNRIVLVDRTLLDTPVTIPANETKHIAYTIRFNYGGAV